MKHGYNHIVAWGRMMGSFQYFIDGEVERARLANAPKTAIYCRSNGSWATYEDIESDYTRLTIDAILERLLREGEVV